MHLTIINGENGGLVISPKELWLTLDLAPINLPKWMRRGGGGRGGIDGPK